MKTRRIRAFTIVDLRYDDISIPWLTNLHLVLTPDLFYYTTRCLRLTHTPDVHMANDKFLRFYTYLVAFVDSLVRWSIHLSDKSSTKEKTTCAFDFAERICYF